MTTHIAAAVGTRLPAAPSSLAVALLAFKAAVAQKRAATELAIAVAELDENMGFNQLGLASVDLKVAMERLVLAGPASQAELAAACRAVASYFDDPMLFDPDADELWSEEIALLRAMTRNAAALGTL